jgi:hypothetical protein
VACLALLAGGTLAGCVTIGRRVQAQDTLDLGLAVPVGTPVRVESFNGGIDASVVAGEEVSASVARTGAGADQEAAEADRDAIAVTLELVEGVALLRALYTPSPGSIGADRGVNVTLRVPASSPLDLVTSNGPVNVDGAVDGVTVRTSNAPVELTAVAGGVAVETSNGPVRVAAGGPVSVALRTSNAGITFSGGLEAGDATFETSNAPVVLRLPAEAAFELDASTSSARVTSAFAVEGPASDDSLSGTVGAPDEAAATRVSVRTSNAPITLEAE